MGETRNRYRIVFGKPPEHQSQDPVEDGRIILKWILQK